MRRSREPASIQARSSLKGTPVGAAAALIGLRAPGLVDQDHAHQFGRERVEMAAVLPVGIALLNQPQIQLVDLLHEWRDGNQDAFERLMPLAYPGA